MARIVKNRVSSRKSFVRSKKRKTVSVRVRESESVLFVFAVFIISLMSFAYILQTNSLATKGYEVAEYEKQLENLKDDYKNMKAVEAELRSIKNLDSEKDRLCTVSSSDIDFIDISTTSVALK